MQSTEQPFLVSYMSDDSRIRVFRRLFAPESAEQMEVDAYVVITTHYVIVLDTLLCPEDMAIVMYAVRDELMDRKLLVVNSHADWDHCWGNGYFTGNNAAPILGQDYCFNRLESEEAKNVFFARMARRPIVAS